MRPATLIARPARLNDFSSDNACGANSLAAGRFAAEPAARRFGSQVQMRQKCGVTSVRNVAKRGQ